jgi:hypothetical protein
MKTARIEQTSSIAIVTYLILQQVSTPKAIKKESFF